MAMNYIRRLSTEILPYHLRSITDVMIRRKAEEELCETDDVRDLGLQELRQKIKEEKTIICSEDSEYLLQFLRARKFNADASFKLLKNFYAVRRKYSDLYKNIDFPGIRKVLKANFLGFLPYRDKEDCVVLLIKLGEWNPHTVSMEDLIRTLTAGLIQAIDDPATQITGFKVIVDFKGFSFRHLRHITPSYLYLCATTLQNSFPGRFRAVHIVNENFLFKYIWNVLKTLLIEKIKNRFLFHGSNVNALKEYFPRTLLPSEYGGNLGPFDNREWAEKMEEFEYRITEHLRYGYRSRNSSLAG